MIKVQSYRATPLLPPDESEKIFRKMDTEWFRVAVNRMYNCNKERLHKAGVNTEIFHNHDEKTGKTKPAYPLIIYHKIDSAFYLTCINQGIETVKELLITLSLNKKIKQLETILHSNIVSDFAKYLDYDLSKTEVSIMNIDLFNRGCLQYKGHDYLPFSLEFEANVTFPDNITLGNGKAFGFGRVNKYP